MGIPRFYRWLSERYPRINQRIEENAELLPAFDNMYLDANGIIHTCSHPNDEDVTSVRLTLEDMAMNMMGYIDNMVKIIRPKKVLFIAVDGCAPRAKMNQQRSRRFASARDSEEATKKAIENGDLTPEEAAQRFDSNAITPGTPFMAELSKHFEFFLRKKLKEDPLWQHLEIIYSGHDVPGEGEHKVMEYIRRVRTEPGYDPNTRHCLCGLDADLMMLGLATHEPHFSLLREEVNFNSFSAKANRNATKEVSEQISKVKWQLLRISTLRDYINLEYAPIKAIFPELNLERVIDDWVVMVMLVGNDFLPHIPTMDIFEGALDSLIKIHKELIPVWKGHMSRDDGTLDWTRVEGLFKRLGALESAVFKLREEDRRERERKQRKQMGMDIDEAQDEDEDEWENEELLHDDLLSESDDLWSAEEKIKQRRRRNNYYLEKFGISPEDPQVEVKIQDIVRRYVEGLDWVFRYYYQGVPSWIWFYPFHYAPLASDVKNLVALTAQINHILGEPFKPFSQLLACLPASSAHCLPRSYQQLMRDPHSPLKAFYPLEWEVDKNGKRNPWEFVNLLPFIDEKKLAEAVATIDPKQLTEEERARNEFGKPMMFRRDLSNTMRLESTLKKLTSLDTCLSSKQEFAFSKHAMQTRHSPNLLPGYRVLPGDSTLYSHPDLSITASGLYLAKLNTFGSSSRKETFVLRFKQDTIPKSPEQIKAFIESNPPSRVWVNFPHLHEGIISSVADVFGNFYDAETRTWREMTAAEKRAFDYEAVSASVKALGGDKVVGTGGIEVDRIYMLIRVRPFLGMKQDPVTGMMKQYFAEVEDETWIPYQLVLFNNPLADPRFIDTPAQPLAERFLKDSKVLCVAEKGYGMLGTVIDADQNSRAVNIRFPSMAPKQNEFGHLVAGTILDSYMSLTKIAQGLNLLPVVIDKFLGSLKVVDLLPKERGRPQIVDLGLNLRVGRNRVVPGYARSKAPEAVTAAWKSGDAVVRIIGSRVDEESSDTRNLGSDAFEYTDRAIELLLKYKAKFPRLFDRVSKKPGDFEYRKADLFNLKEAPDEPELVMTWLRQIPTYGIPLVPTSSKFMSRKAILAVQTAADEHVRTEAARPPPPEVIISLPPHVLVRPPTLDHGTIESPSMSAAPSLGDRVCNLGNPTIPFGLRGTVVAIHPSTGSVQVVFDTPFVGGTSLSGMCRPLYGALLPASHILNLSKKTPVPLEGPIEKTAKKTAPRPVPFSAGRKSPEKTPRTPSPAAAAKQGEEDNAAPRKAAASTAQPVAQAIPQQPIPATIAATNAAPSADEVDDLGSYFKKLMASKQKNLSTSSAAAASSAPAQQTAATTAAAAKKSTPKKEAAKAQQTITKIAKRPEAPLQQQQREEVPIPTSPVVAPALSPITTPGQSPVQPPLMRVTGVGGPGTVPPVGFHGAAPPKMPVQQPTMFPPGHPMGAPMHFVPAYLPPGALPPATNPIQAPPAQPVPPAPAVKPTNPNVEKASAVLDSVFKRAFQTENRVFEN